MDLNFYVVQFASLAVVITMTVQGLRKSGMDDKYSILVSWGLGIFISLGAFLITAPDNSLWINMFYAFLNGMGLGAMSNGIYDAILNRNVTDNTK